MHISPTLLERLLNRLNVLPVPVLDSFAGIIYGRVLTIAVRRGFFESLAHAPQNTAQIASATKLHESGVELMAESFVIGGYLKKRAGRYSLTRGARKWFLRQSPNYLGNILEYFEMLYWRWGDFERSLEHGRPSRPYYEGFGEKDWRVYVNAMHDLARLLLPEVMPKVRLSRNSRRLLDVGGSHGLYSVECCRKYPGLSASILDFAPALVHTKDLLAHAGLTGRCSTIEGDFLQCELPVENDCILLFNVIHGLTEQQNLALIRKSYYALRTGGKLFLLDQMKGETAASALGSFIPLMVGLNMLNEIGGTSYATSEVRDWCGEFSAVKVYRLRIPGITLIEAVK